MELKEYTKEAIIQIVSAITEANKVICQYNSFIASSAVISGAGSELSRVEVSLDHYRTVMNVDFDVAVEVIEQTGLAGGAKLSVALPFLKSEVGGSANDKSENRIINRMKFSVPVALPEDYKITEEIVEKYRNS